MTVKNLGESTAILIVFGSCLMAGCNVGMTASGGTPEEVKQKFDTLPLEERAKSIMSSPATMEFKKQRIKEMYEKEGKEPPADIMNQAPRTGGP